MSYGGVLKWWHPVSMCMLGGLRFSEEGQNAVTVNPWAAIDIGELEILLAATGSAFDWGRWHFRTLLERLAGALTRAIDTTNEYDIIPASPASFASETGLQIVRTAGSRQFAIDWSHADSTLEPRLLGFAPDASSAVFSSGGAIVGPYSYIGAWHLDADSPPLVDLRPETDRLRTTSTLGPRYGYANEWLAPDGKRGRRVPKKVRRLECRTLEAARVFAPRGENAADADRAGIPTGDQSAQLEHVWRWAPLGPGWLDPDWSGNTLEVDTSSAEPVQWARRDQIDELDQAIDDEDGDDHETYQVGIRLDVGDTSIVEH